MKIVTRFSIIYFLCSSTILQGSGYHTDAPTQLDTIEYTNPEIEKFITSLYQNKRGEVKKGREELARIITILNQSEHLFVFHDQRHQSSYSGRDIRKLGEFKVSADGSQFLIVIPDHTSGPQKELLDLFGGRGVLAGEEIFHAYQLLQGKLIVIEEDEKSILSVSDKCTMVELEVDAKLFAVNNRLGQNSFKKKGFYVKTIAGLIRRLKGNKAAIARLLTQPTQYKYQNRNGSIKVNYPASYMPWAK